VCKACRLEASFHGHLVKREVHLRLFVGKVFPRSSAFRVQYSASFFAYICMIMRLEFGFTSQFPSARGKEYSSRRSRFHSLA